MTIYAYYRVSTDRQDFENQKSGVLAFCKAKGLNIDYEIIDDGVSGTKEPNKRHLGKALKHIRSGDTLIISELSRLGRKLFMIFRILEELLNKEVIVYSVKDGYILDNTIQSKVLAFAFGMAAEIERDMISKRTKEALVKKKAEGVILGRPKGKKNSTYKLSDKTETIRRLIQQGYNNKQICKKLKVSYPTLKKYIDNYL